LNWNSEKKAQKPEHPILKKCTDYRDLEIHITLGLMIVCAALASHVPAPVRRPDSISLNGTALQKSNQQLYLFARTSTSSMLYRKETTNNKNAKKPTAGEVIEIDETPRNSFFVT